jgi:phosphonopyruvate decarboxylase
MISAKQFVANLNRRGIRFFSGVPCSYFTPLVDFLRSAPGNKYCIAPNEGAALALASGAYLGGQKSCVLAQNSGLGNLINPLTSLNLIYDIPVLILISGRAYGIPDEPQHEVMGRCMGDLLKAIGIPFWDLPQTPSASAAVFSKALATMESTRKPVVLFVKKGTFAQNQSSKSDVKVDRKSSYPMRRIEAIRIIAGALEPDDLVFATTGKPSRELFAIHDRPGNFYMQGSMGHVGSLALGTALCKPSRRVIVLDGDGAFLMHLGTLSAIGHYHPSNFFHLLLDNESYETTGDQDTTSATTDFSKMALAAGYKNAYDVSDPRIFKKELPRLLKKQGPVLVRVKINRLPTSDIPRITTKYLAPDITGGFQRFLTRKRKRGCAF